MRALGISLGLILVLVVFGTYVFKDTAAAQGNLVADMLDLPAPPPPNPLTVSNYIERDDSFYDVRKPPADDAPIEELIDYWRSMGYRRNPLYYKPKPSEAVVKRLKEAIRDEPSLLGGLLQAMPDDEETADFVRSTARQMSEDQDEEEGDAVGVDAWLKYNSGQFSDALAASSQEIKDSDGYVTNHEDLLALTKHAPRQAEPIIDRLYNDPSQPVSQTLAKWALYRRALLSNSLGDIERYRDELKAVVEDRNATGGMRDLALDALLKEKEWPGRDDWYFGLMEDETLAKVMVGGREYTGLTTMMYYSPPDRYVGKMIELLKSSNPAIRNAAVKNLGIQIGKDSPEVVRALLPWLENQAWAKESGGERSRIIEALQYIEMPESVPGLIDILDEKTKSTRRVYPMSNSNSNTNTVIDESLVTEMAFETMAHRVGAVKALGRQKDPRAVGPLRRLLSSSEIEPYERSAIVRSIWLCKGFSIKEQVDGLENYVKTAVKEAKDAAVNTDPDGPYYYTAANTAPARPKDTFYLLGEQLQESHDAEEALVSGTLDRVDLLARRDPPASGKLTEIVEGWTGPAVNAMMLRNLKADKATLDSAVKLLSIRKELMEKQAEAVYDARGGTPAALGIATCILNNNGGYDALLAGQDTEAKAAMLACARLIRADLPVSEVIPYLDSAHKTLATAAERYLEANDSPEARIAVLSRHPGEARILGSQVSFVPEGVEKPMLSKYLQPLFASIPGAHSYASYLIGASFEELDETEERLRKEVKENESLRGIYSYDSNFIRIFQDKAVFSWEDDEARYYERTLEPQEFERFKAYLVTHNADAQPPYITSPPHHGESTHVQLLMLGRQGGRRVFLSSPGKSKFFEGLDKEFEEMRKPPAKLHYWLEKDIPGLEILFSDRKLKATAFWKNGADMRVLIHDEEREEQILQELEKEIERNGDLEGAEYEAIEEATSKKRAQSRYAHLSWHTFAGKPGALAAQPAEIPIISYDSLDVPPDDENPYRTKRGNIEIRSHYDGLYKIVNGQSTKVTEDYYYSLFLVPGGKWAFGSSYRGDTGLDRINLQTGKATSVKIREGMRGGMAVAYLSSINKVLLSDGDRYRPIKGNENYTLIDPETGAFQPVKGEFRPLAQQTIRALQKGPGPDEYWAAIPVEKATEVGIYNMRTFSFKPVQKVPRISFSSMEMWVDDKEGRIYLTYSGHLLSIPLKK